MKVAQSPRGCDFCKHDIPAAVVYPAASFIGLLVTADGEAMTDADGRTIPLQGLNGAWMACADCAPLIDANDWDAMVERYYAVTGHPRANTERLLTSLWWGFRRNRRGGPLPIAALDNCTHEQTEWVRRNANPAVPPGLTCMLCGDVLKRLQ